jgi:ubiquinone/menaquinone biosynthesis C-methylase UbiE
LREESDSLKLVVSNLWDKRIERLAWLIKRNAVYAILRNLRKANIIVDAGCGDCSEFIKYLRMHPSSYGVGVDVKPNVSAIEHDMKKRLEVIVADVRHLPLRNTSIDLITSTEIIEHFIEGEQFIKEVSRCLKQNGMVIITTPNRLSLWGVVKRCLIRFICERPTRSFDYHVREYTPHEIVSILQKLGIEVRHQMYLALDPYALTRLITPKAYLILNKIATFKMFAPLTKWDFIIVGVKK